MFVPWLLEKNQNPEITRLTKNLLWSCKEDIPEDWSLLFFQLGKESR